MGALAREDEWVGSGGEEEGKEEWGKGGMGREWTRLKGGRACGALHLHSLSRAKEREKKG